MTSILDDNLICSTEKDFRVLPTWSDGNSFLISNNHSVLTSHRAVQEITKIVQVVIRGKYACVNAVLFHVMTYAGQSTIHFFGGKQLLALK